MIIFFFYEYILLLLSFLIFELQKRMVSMLSLFGFLDFFAESKEFFKFASYCYDELKKFFYDQYTRNISKFREILLLN